jgi:omega-amidase
MNSTLKVAIIQSNLHWENISANLKMFDEKISAIKKEETDVIILPEMFTTGFTMNAANCFETMNGKAMEWMKEKATQTNAAICGSLIIKENEQYFNRLIWMQTDGNLFTYDKHHLFRLSNEHKTYTAGNQRQIVDWKGWKINLNVCYDLRFPVWSRQKKASPNLSKGEEEIQNYRGEYDALLYVANWPERRNTAWKALLQARAIENQCYVIGANRVGDDGNKIYHSGDSSIISPSGEIIARATNEEKIISAELSIDELIAFRRTYQFWKDADEFNLHLPQ